MTSELLSSAELKDPSVKVKGAPPTHARLLELLRYDPDTGLFTWIRRQRFHRDPAGSINQYGYRMISVDNCKHCSAHRLAWLYVYGEWPKGHIDHINGDPADNRIVNLRDVTRSVNMQNRRAKSKSKSGLLGACTLASGRYMASIRAGGRQIALGCYGTAEEAHEAYLTAKRLLHEGCVI